jgi:3-isopropylmalate dehydrogenase
MKRSHTVACLGGDGVGPELIAEATRVLSRLSKLHSLDLDEVHLPFGGEAVTQVGHRLPSSTRAGYRSADAILVALPHEPALDGIKADLELGWRVSRVDVGAGGDVVVFGPVGSEGEQVAIERSFLSAASRRGRVTSVDASTAWRELVEAEHSRWGGMTVEHLTLGEMLVRLRRTPPVLDVVLVETHLVSSVVDAVSHLAGSPETVAHAWLSNHGPGVFTTGTCDSLDSAGFGVTDPTAILLAVSLLLAEGLQHRSAARTLQRAVGAVTGRNGSAPTGTRPFADAVIDQLADARTDVEHFDGVPA